MKQSRTLSSPRGMTLVEVMISACIFTILGLTTTAVFIGNYRAIVTFRYRTHATNAALNIIEQIRLRQYSEIKALHDTVSPAPAPTILVSLADPNFSPASPLVPPGYRPILLKLNVIDGIQKDANWTTVDLPLESSAGAPKVHTRFWTTVNANISTSTPVVQVYEIVVVYQWKNPEADASQKWQSSTTRLTMPNPNPYTT